MVGPVVAVPVAHSLNTRWIAIPSRMCAVLAAHDDPAIRLLRVALAVLDAAGAAEGTGVFKRAVRTSQDHLVASVIPHIPATALIEMRAGRGGVAGAFAGVN